MEEGFLRGGRHVSRTLSEEVHCPQEMNLCSCWFTGRCGGKAALVDEGIPVHLVWILQCINFGQCGEVVGDLGHSSKFNITGCVRQGCVLSPNGRCDNGGQCRKCRFQLDGQRS